MNRFRLDLLRRANGAIFHQQFFTNEAVQGHREPPSRQARTPRSQGSRHYRLEDPAETIRNISMNPLDIMNLSMHDNENEYIYKYLHRILDERYTPLMIADIRNSTIYQHIGQLMRLSDMGRDQFLVKQICESIRSKIQSLNLDELEALLTALRGRQLEDIKALVRNIDLRLNTILKYDSTFQPSLQLDRLFYLADLLYESRVKSSFIKTLANTLSRNLASRDVSDRQLLHLLFLTILERHSSYLLPKFERRIFEMLGTATIEELSIICQAYFKTKTLIKDKGMVDKILDQTKRKLTTLDPREPAYCSIVKSVRYSRDPSNREKVVQLITALLQDPEHQVMFGSAYNAVHTIKLMEAFRVYEPKMLHILRCLIFRDLSDFRIKDIQYALTSLSNMTYMDLRPDENLIKDFDLLVDTIVSRSRQDVSHQNYHLVPIIRAFAIFGYHNSKMMSYARDVLSDDRQMQRMSTVLEFDKSTLLVHAAYSIEQGDSSLLTLKPLLDRCSSSIERMGNRGSVKQDMSLDYLNFVLKGNKRNLMPNSAMFRSIAESLANHDELKSESYNFNFQFTFSHQNYSDLVITRDGPEPGSFDSETLLPRLVPANTKSCMVFATQKTDFIDGHSRLCGYKQLLIRMMQKLGYFVLPVDLHQPDINDLARKVRMIFDSSYSGR